ncbi:hypothetical protein D9M71_703570 [compost metagenome]
MLLTAKALEYWVEPRISMLMPPALAVAPLDDQLAGVPPSETAGTQSSRFIRPVTGSKFSSPPAAMPRVSRLPSALNSRLVVCGSVLAGLDGLRPSTSTAMVQLLVTGGVAAGSELLMKYWVMTWALPWES